VDIELLLAIAMVFFVVITIVSIIAIYFIIRK